MSTGRRHAAALLDAQEQAMEQTETAIAEMHRGENSACVADPVFTRRSLESEGVWARAPSWLDDAIDMGFIESEEVASWKRACSLS